MVYQAAKISDKDLQQEYLDWLRDLEFNKFAFTGARSGTLLDMPPRFSFEFIENREEQDIHERDREYLLSTYEHAVGIARSYKWSIINCTGGGAPVYRKYP